MSLMSESKCCEYCDDGNGSSVFPYYGVAPHTGTFNSKTLPETEFPSNFDIDGEWSESACNGVYTHCLNCGAGKDIKITEDI
ncbi:hypothetical protein [Acinetobacter seifertii]|uniref:hypothetical protein n=1 Tax=Acinetobacter seifertii TaxID=1530123 RepID=UPI0019036C6D|nr:hypothetical protein [Acinetobacter seifertii]MBJ9425154.1 hypothetical protein [Acinetobacter seifertii]